jgi:hypothetical protein
MLANKDQTLATAAQKHIPKEGKDSKKRKADENGDGPIIKRRSTSKSTQQGGDLTLGDREEHAMEALFAYVEEKGGPRECVQNFRCRVTRKASDGRYDTNYYNEQGRRFRSMVEVGRYLKLVTETTRSAAGKKTAGIKKRKATSREIEAEKKKLRKDLEKLRKQHTKVTKALDDFQTDEKESRYPIEDMLLQEEEEASQKVTNCPAARIPDIDNISGLPRHCMQDVLVAWDFLSTFTRALSVNPITLGDFIECLTYKAPPQLSDSDALYAPPVYLGEAHLGLLKLILADRSSDDWWWSILETDVTENAVVAASADAVGSEDSDLPLIKVDFAALLVETEDPLITTSWLQNLESVRKLSVNDTVDIRDAIKKAMGVAANKWVLAYLRKALKLGKTSGASFMKRSVVWLISRVKDARPDLGSRSVNEEELFKERAKIVEEVSQQMEKLSSAALTVNDDDLVSDIEDSDDESDDSDDEEDKESTKDAPVPQSNPIERPASYVPKKPAPSLVDLLLPPGKPIPPNDVLNPASWPCMVGAAVSRIIHRYKRLRNEMDDSLRLIRELSRLTVKQRREREEMVKNRVFSEFATVEGDQDPSERAVNHLCSGGNYLDLSPLERLCVLRILIDAAYDTGRLYEVIDSNHKQRTNAVKALDTEQRRAKREAKEKAAADAAAARQELALEAKRNFIEEKREEIRKANEANHELTEDEIEELTEQDILDFDDDIKADFEALPAPESFKKAEVDGRVLKIQEAAAFETELLTVLSMEELLEREKTTVVAMEEQLQELGGEDALMDPALDRTIARTIEKLRRELGKVQVAADMLPIQREAATDSLKEAIADGTIKSLRAAIRIAKTARLFGPDEETNGVWALDVVRDAHMELENAKQLKRVADAQKDLVTKLNKCFIRTEPLGSDRFKNRLWHFENTEQCHVWAEVNPVLTESNSQLSNQPGYLELVLDASQVSIGAEDIEEDFIPKYGAESMDHFRLFSRKEYHPSGATASLTKRHWGCHVNESSVRALIKGLDGRGVRENELKNNLKEALEKGTAHETSAEEPKTSPGEAEESKSADADEEEAAIKLVTGGDASWFAEAKRAARDLQSDVIQHDLLESLSSGIGQKVRVRIVVDTTKDNEVARYEVGSITGWKVRKDSVNLEPDGDEFEPQTELVDTPVWRAWTDEGQEIWLTGTGLLESICRSSKWKSKDASYFEHDSAFLAYRNGLGRHCGKAADAAHAMTPIRFTQFMVKREAELYQRLKHLVYDNSWGGKNGTRNVWIASMKDFAFDLETAREGLLTLESAFLELTGGFPGESNGDSEPSGKALLDNPITREDIELESIEKGMNGLWNSRASRAVFLEIMKTCKTVGCLALGFELLCRNTKAYVDVNTVKSAAASSQEPTAGYYDATTTRASRRMNTWQQPAEEAFHYEDAPMRSSRRGARVNYAGLD